MKTAAERARKWLRVYPRAYRERRGDELVATLLDKSRDDPRLPLREIAAVIGHGSLMRVRQLRVVTIAAAIVVVGAGVGAGVSIWSGPNGYSATTTVWPSSYNAAPDKGALLGALDARFGIYMRSSGSVPLLTRDLAPPYPTCATAVVTRGILLQCTAPSASTARTATFDLSLGFAAMYGQVRHEYLLQSVQGVAFKEVTDRTERAAVAVEVAMTRNPILRGGLAHNFNLLTDQIASLQNIENIVRNELRNPGALLSEVASPPVATHGLRELPISLGALVGLLIGIAVGTRTRSRRGQPGPLPA